MTKQIATLGGGCFWCTEAIFNQIRGVEKVVSGYAGGNVPGHPTYREICSGLTGHAEVIQITFNPEEVTYEELLIIFMTTHDPTTLNKQGADVGTQYRSVIFFQNEQEEIIANKIIEEVQPYFESAIVTEVSKLPVFYLAGNDHQNYYENNKEQGYCNFVILPKLNKLRKMYADKLKA